MLIIVHSRQNSLMNTLTADESAPTTISLSLENIDLKIFETEPWSNELVKINLNSIHPYEYQCELVQSAIQAGNTIVCLRTGGGKTFVAG